MANELNISLNLRCNNGDFEFQGVKNFAADQTTVGGGAPGSQVVPTASTLIDGLASLTGQGFFLATNVDSTNFVELGIEVAATFYPVLKLKPGESCIARLSSTAMYAKADTASVTLQMEVMED